MGSRRYNAFSPMAGFLGCLASALLQIFLALAPVDAIADDTGLENATTATHALAGGDNVLILAGDDPRSDPLKRAFEPGEFLAYSRQAELPAPTSSFEVFADAISFAGVCEHYYRVRAPPHASFP
jgi:hypothetical protein